MKILLIAPSSFMSEKFSDVIYAPRSLVISLADGLVERGWEIILATSPDVATRAAILEGDRDLLNLLVEKHSRRNETIALREEYEFIKRDYEIDLFARAFDFAVKNGVEIVHVYHKSMGHYFEAFLKDIPVIYTLHDPLPVSNSLSFEILNKFSMHRFVSVSQFQRESNNLSLNFIGNVYHGLNKDAYSMCILPKSDHFSFIGRLVPQKGLETVIEARKSLDFRLKLATTQTELKLHSKEEALIKNSLTKDDILITDYLVKSDKSDFFGQSRALLFPILWEEPFGLVMIESMACGTPVIAFARGSVKEIVVDGKTGFIINSKKDDIRGDWIIKKTGLEGFIEAIKRIKEMGEDEYRQMRLNCRRHVEENFTIESMVKGYEKVYKKVLGIK